MDAFTLEPYCAARFDALARRHPAETSSPEALIAWQRETRERLRALIGLEIEDERTPPRMEIVESRRMDGYTREKLLIQTGESLVMPTYRLIPDDLKEGGRRPAVIAAHGHLSHGKDAIVGNRVNAALAESIDKHRYDYGLSLVRAGFIVYCPDAAGFGERREPTMRGDEPEKMLGNSCRLINHMLLPLGQTITAIWVRDLMRLVDYVLSEPSTLSGRIGCAGLSGGGAQTLWLGVFDTRVTCLVVSGYFYGVKQSLLEMNGNCSCNYIPNLWRHVDMGDLGAMVAPRPLLIVTGDKDPLSGRDGVQNVTPQVEIARGAYAALHASGRLEHHVFHGAHQWRGERALPFLRHWLWEDTP